jgi:hypothetical protein
MWSMKVCILDRGAFFGILGTIFRSAEIQPEIAELGVLRGENAMKMYQAMAPKHMVLIDSWNAKSLREYSPFPELPPWIWPMNKFDFYFGGPIGEQQTWDKLYEQCKVRFAKTSNVTFINQDTVEAIKNITALSGVEKFDVIYIDSNHQYEYVLRDLMLYNSMVKPDGVFLLKNCCHSVDSLKQNVGTLEAVCNFVKRTDFVPVALTHQDWTEVMLARRGSFMEQAVDRLLSHSNVSYVEVPPQLLPAMKIVDCFEKKNISFI